MMISMPVTSWIDHAKSLRQWQKKQQAKTEKIQPTQPTTPVNNERKPK
jgi:hypothetical protein